MKCGQGRARPVDVPEEVGRAVEGVKEDELENGDPVYSVWGLYDVSSCTNGERRTRTLLR